MTETTEITKTTNPDDEMAGVLNVKRTSGLSWDEFAASCQRDVEAAQRTLDRVRLWQRVILADGGQLPLIPDVRRIRKPRAKSRTMLHVVDGEFRCRKCGYSTGGAQGMDDAKKKRKIPCPRCLSSLGT